ncbi:MAG: beta-L-arabinofuranosidase domain-containing protein [Verrucomicrobiota bacterium]
MRQTFAVVVLTGYACGLLAWSGEAMGASSYRPNREPLAPKPYSELPLGAIQARGWLGHQLQSMANGMTGHLDTLYPEVVGPRNGWLGGDGDGWERGPYWIDGLLPLAHLLKDDALLAKANQWVEWTLANQREDGYLGPIPFETPPANEPGIQRGPRRDWWPKMVMLKVLQQHYNATSDPRVIEALTRYFRFQLQELPKTPLGHWSFWGNRRGGDNLLVVYWLYNITGDSFLLDLGDLIIEQTHPYTEIFLERGDIELERYQSGKPGASPFHCVNLAQGIKQPVVLFQAHQDPKHLEAVKKAFADLERFHGHPNGMYGGDEGLHGRAPTQGSELCSTVEMMFSLEKMLEITGDLAFADLLEKLAFNMLPSQVNDDFTARQYFQQANQIACTASMHNFFDHAVDGNVYGLLSGYPCCTCNLHQGWPKFVQHLWMATADHGLAALAYAPSAVTARVADGQEVSLVAETGYPFEETIRFTIQTDQPVDFPLHLRIPLWCKGARVTVNGAGQPVTTVPGQTARLSRLWVNGDSVELTLPMTLRQSRWHENSLAIERGPLLFALRIEEEWSPQPGFWEVRPASPWNYALLESALADPEAGFEIVDRKPVGATPWNLQDTPITLQTRAVRLPHWQAYNDEAGPLPWSPQNRPGGTTEEPVHLVPYGCTTLRISAFPTLR